MNKRQRKKNKQKQELFMAFFASSYREVRENNRYCRRCILNAKRYEKRKKALGLPMWYEEYEI